MRSLIFHRAQPFVLQYRRTVGNPSWDQNLEKFSTLSELISELRKDVYLFFSLELCLMTIFSGKNMRRTPGALKTTKIASRLFRDGFSPRVYWTYQTVVISSKIDESPNEGVYLQITIIFGIQPHCAQEALEPPFSASSYSFSISFVVLDSKESEFSDLIFLGLKRTKHVYFRIRLPRIRDFQKK